jgi:DNA-nicking Smr family endonuclease
MSRRIASEEERREFERAFRRGHPLSPLKRAASAPKKKPAAISGSIAGTRRKHGLLVPDARLDLHGLSEAAAHRALRAFLADAQAGGRRLALVVTGKGNPGGDDTAPWMQRRAGVLKEMVPRWLAEPAFARMVASVRPAHLRHGGGGALYVALRKR